MKILLLVSKANYQQALEAIGPLTVEGWQVTHLVSETQYDGEMIFTHQAIVAFGDGVTDYCNWLEKIHMQVHIPKFYIWLRREFLIANVKPINAIQPSNIVCDTIRARVAARQK